MKYCIVEIKSQTASFRNPEFQNFHKTLPLPPPTTLIGFAGAALGINSKDAQDFFVNSNFEMGVYCKNFGMAVDLWKYNNFSGRSIILREILFQCEIILIYGSDDVTKVDKLISSFEEPVYVLTMGSSDSLVKVISISSQFDTNESNEVSHCLIEGDIIKDVLSNSHNRFDFSIYSTSDPLTLDLPVRFSYLDDFGMRSVIKRKQFSLISNEMKLNVTKKGVFYKKVFVPLFNV